MNYKSIDRILSMIVIIINHYKFRHLWERVLNECPCVFGPSENETISPPPMLINYLAVKRQQII